MVYLCNVFAGLTISQSEMLYVFDPLALHHIVVKEQYTYEETSTFIEYVSDYHLPG